MASKAKRVDDKDLETANRKLKAALDDCRRQLERAERLIESRQDNNFRKVG